MKTLCSETFFHLTKNRSILHTITELWAAEFQDHLMSFSGTTVIKIAMEETSHGLCTWNFVILIFINVFVGSLKIVCHSEMPS